jgi:hypothetical protein
MNVELHTPQFDLPEAEIRRRFTALQDRLVPLWQLISTIEDIDAQTIVVVPSITGGPVLLGSEAQAYEERFLFLLLLLRQPSARLIYCSSQAIAPAIVDYYLGLLPGLIGSHARKRLFLVSPHDSSGLPLTLKLLQRPGLMERIRRLIPDPSKAHLVPFLTTVHERDLALRLGIPMYGADPEHLSFGTKSGGRKLFRRAGVRLPAGFEDLRSFHDVVDAVRELKRANPGLRWAMVKHDEGVSGDGNAQVDLSGIEPAASREQFVERVRELRLESRTMDFDIYFERMEAGGVVEERLIADRVESPSAQLRITPLGRIEMLSTHDQLLGGPTGQSFLGSTFPARPAYGSEVARTGIRVAELLAEEGLLGRFGIDFLAIERDADWLLYAIELNLRKGGTTHPFLTLQYITGGAYDWQRNEFRTGLGEVKHYLATDHLEDPRFRALDHERVFDLAVRSGLHYDPSRHKGVVFHMISALGDRGRIGLTAIGDSHEEARELYGRTLQAFEAAADDELRERPLPGPDPEPPGQP